MLLQKQVCYVPKAAFLKPNGFLLVNASNSQKKIRQKNAFYKTKRISDIIKCNVIKCEIILGVDKDTDVTF